MLITKVASQHSRAPLGLVWPQIERWERIESGCAGAAVLSHRPAAMGSQWGQAGNFSLVLLQPLMWWKVTAVCSASPTDHGFI